LTLVGVLDGRARAVVDSNGRVSPAERTWWLDWWIGADDRWRVPERETAVRQTLLDDVPVVQTAMRLPGGDVLQRVYGARLPGEAVVVEIENASAVPFVVAFVVGGAQRIALDGTTVVIDGRRTMLASRAPSRWAVNRSGSTDVEVCSGAARTGPFPATRSRTGAAEAAFLHPVAHRTTLTVALALGGRDDVTDLAHAPAADAVVRSWGAQLDRGTRVELPDDRLMGAVRSARATALLAGTRRAPAGLAVAALEDWGFDAEAADGFMRLTGRERRVARRRPGAVPTWDDIELTMIRGEAEWLLLALRALLVREDGDDVSLLETLPPAWNGQPIAVHDAPVRRGLVSFAVRWHGPRPALLWDVPPGMTVRAPGLDPAWLSTEPSGETLLAAGVGLRES
jgi:hypothetical protein